MALRFGITFFRSVEPDEKDAATYDDEALAKVSFDRIPVAAARSLELFDTHVRPALERKLGKTPVAAAR